MSSSGIRIPVPRARLPCHALRGDSDVVMLSKPLESDIGPSRPGRWVGVVLGVLLFVAGCAEPNSPAGISVVERRLAPRDASALGWCAAGEEIRPAIGCPEVVEKLSRLWPPGKEPKRFRSPRPASLNGLPFVVTPIYRGSKAAETFVGDSFLVGSRAKAINHSFAPPELALQKQPPFVRMVALTESRTPRSFEVEPFDVPPNAEIRVGIGFVDLPIAVPQVPTTFSIQATDEAGAPLQEILREESGDGIADGWRDVTADLGPFAGRRVGLRFTAQLSVETAQPGPSPLWSAPQILARAPRDGRRSVVFVSLDTLRGDYVGKTLDGKSLTPHLDALREQGTTFVYATAPNPTTTASHMSLFSSLYPLTHGVWGPQRVVEPSVPLLTELMAAEGYETAAVTENAMLAAAAGFRRGFDSYREERGLSIWETAGSIEQTFGAGVEWVAAHRDELFFLFLHTYQVHAPRSPPDRFDAFSAGLSEGASEEEREQALYAAEVVYTDEQMGALVTKLQELVPSEDLLVVIFSDHGEAFGRNDEHAHGTALFETTLNVPLIFWGPGRVPADRVVEMPVSLVDVGPTLLDMSGHAWPEPHQGRSLAPWLEPVAAEPDGVPVFAVTHRANRLPGAGDIRHSTAMRVGPHKWVRLTGEKSEEFEVFDLGKDPLESAGVAVEGDPTQRILAWEAEQEAAAASIGASAERKDRIDPGLGRKLKALGYVD